MKKVGTSGTLALPQWTQEVDQQEDKKEIGTFQSVPKLEQKLEHFGTPCQVPKWVPIVKAWTPRQTAAAWPVIDWIIREDGETEAAAWVYEQSAEFFRKTFDV